LLKSLTKVTESDDQSVRSEAVRTLSHLVSWEDGIAIMTKAATDENPDVRGTAIEFLATAGAKAKDALPQLLAAAKDDEYPGIRTQALAALSNFDLDSKTALPILRKALKDDSHEVRMAALGVAAKLGPQAKDLVAPLSELLKKADKLEE